MADDHNITKETAGKAEGTEPLCFLWEIHWSLFFFTMSMLLSVFRFENFVGFVTQLCSPSNVCVWSVDTFVYTQSSLSVFTMLGTAVLSSLHWCGCSFVKLAFYLHHTPISALASQHNGTNNAWTRTPPYYRHVSSPWIPGLYHIQSIDHIKMADEHDV